MEDALVLEEAEECAKEYDVLILVLMEDALVLEDGEVYLAANYTVLILVLMEDALVLTYGTTPMQTQQVS